MTDDFDDVADLLRRSVLGRAIHAVVAAAARALESSRGAGWVRTKLAAVAQLTRDEGVRLVALGIVAAAAAEFILSAFIPARSAPAIPQALWLVIGLTA